MSLKRSMERRVGACAAPAEPEEPRDGLRRDLARRGVKPAVREALVERLGPDLDALDGEAYEALLAGVTAAYEIEHATHEELRRNLRELRELERLMGSFSGELSKLDEALEVLAAYLRRMRTSSSGQPHRIVH